MADNDPHPWLILAGVVVTLALFLLVFDVVRTLRSTWQLAVVLTAIAAVIGALPPVLDALAGQRRRRRPPEN